MPLAHWSGCKIGFRGGVMEKLPGEMAKKMLPSAWTWMRVAEDVSAGSMTVQAPVLGAPVASVIGKVRPPLVESTRVTVAALMGALAVPATFQVTVCAPDQFAAAAGASEFL